MKKMPLILALLVCGCTPAIIGLSVAMGGASVAVSYQIVGNDAPCCHDAGAD